MPLWVVRAGKHGEQEETAVKECLVCHGWNELPDYSGCLTKDDLRVLYREKYPAESEKQVISGLGQVWRFARTIQMGDLVALPLKTGSAFAFGRVTGDYKYEEVAPNVMHTRRVEWIRTVPRSVFPQDVIFSMNASLTVFKVSRNDAEGRVNKILDSRPLSVAAEGTSADPAMQESAGDETTDPRIDLAEAAHDEVLRFIQDKFKGHDLTRLVAAVLRAQGYKTKVSPPGPDGGVDILAGSGSLGFDQPRLCVQVKSGISPAGQGVFNELGGVMRRFDSTQGLFVSWGGFTNPVKADARKEFFKIRLWDQGDVVDAVLENYELLDDDIKAELSLKKIWVMVNEEAE